MTSGKMFSLSPWSAACQDLPCTFKKCTLFCCRSHALLQNLEIHTAALQIRLTDTRGALIYHRYALSQHILPVCGAPVARRHVPQAGPLQSPLLLWDQVKITSCLSPQINAMEPCSQDHLPAGHLELRASAHPEH